MEAYLAHHGVKGQKWGVRRFQNADGTLTAEGKVHYGKHPEYEKMVSNRSKKNIRVKDVSDKEFKKAKKLFDEMDKIDEQEERELIARDRWRSEEWKRRNSGDGQKGLMGSFKAVKTNGVYDRPDGSKDLNRLKKDAKKRC